MVSRDRKYKRWIFLASYALFALIDTVQRFFGHPERGMADFDMNSAMSLRLRRLNSMSVAVMFGVCFVLLTSMERPKSSKNMPVNFLITGLSLWLVWGSFIQFGGLALFAGSVGRNALIKMCVFVMTLVMAVKIAEAYDLRKELVGITAFILGTVLLFAYVTHFNGMEFLAGFSNILSVNDRYRFSFGLGHYNTAGRLSLYYFMYTAIYKALLEEKEQYNYLQGGGHKNFRSDALYKYLLCISPVITIMLISSASRTSITSLTGFWLMYCLLGLYPKIRATAKVMMIVAGIYICIILAAALDWGKIWADFTVYSLRGENYASTLPFLTAKNTWLAGMGFGFLENLNRLRTVTYLDSFYLYILMESGIAGFFLLIGTILCFTLMYFRDTKYMTKFHRLAGGLLSVMLWYALFETVMFSVTSTDMLNWILLIIATDERYSRMKAVNHNQEALSLNQQAIKLPAS